MQGFNMGRYHPPDDDDAEKKKRTNSQKPHPLGARASRLASHGVLVVRFEMPFAVWCASCARPTLIGQGVRFNAEKRRVGSHHSTPVWGFRVRHGECGGWIELRTDPARGDFVVVSGARRRHYGGHDGEGPEDDSLVKLGWGSGAPVIQTERERAEQRESAFDKLEKTIADRERLIVAGRRIGELQEVAERQWDDPYSQNQRLRRAFRAERHRREREAARADELKERMGLGIELLPETEEDAKRAALVDFGGDGVADADGDIGVEKALARPLFGGGEPPQEQERKKQKKDGDIGSTKGQRKLKSEIATSRTRESLVSEIINNTRASRDPFLDFGSKGTTPKGPTKLPGLKRKRVVEEEPERLPSAPDGDAPKMLAGTTALVSYDSDSD
ncbi:hypothetical protein VTK26DRAFT_5354 [Humicola hyalothermophila]